MFGIKKRQKSNSCNDVYEKVTKLEEKNRQLEYELEEIKECKPTCLKHYILLASNIDYDLFDNCINHNNLVRVDIIAGMELIKTEDELPVLWYGVKVVGYTDDGEIKDISKIDIDVNADGCINSKIANLRRLNSFELTLSIANYILLEFKRGLSRSCVKCELNIIENRLDGLLG